MKKSIVAIAMIFAIMLAGCGQKPAAPSNEPASSAKPYVPVIALGFQHQFWQAVKLGAEQAAADYNLEITFEGPQEETMVDKQVDMMKTALAKKPVGIAMAAIDVESVTPDLEAAKKNGLKIVGFDSGLGDSLPDTTCTTDNYGAGVIAAQNAARLMKEKGQVAVVGHSQTMPDAKARVDGFVETIKKDYPDITVVDVQYGDGDHLKSADIAKSFISAHPDLSCIYGSNEGSAVGIYNGVKEINKIGDIIIIGFDSSEALKAAVRSGEIAGAITQDPVGMGYKSVEAVAKLLNGEKLPELIDTGCYWYDSSNMDDDKIKPLLYD